LRCFAATINQLKGKVGMVFITHAMPKNLQVDEVVRIGQGSLSAVNNKQGEQTVQETGIPKEGNQPAHLAQVSKQSQSMEMHSAVEDRDGRREA
jgi:hypothetical protein